VPKIKRVQLQKHIVVPDTNILWDKDKKRVVCDSFNNFWNSNANLSSLELVVPAVVLGELKFQQTTSAVKIANAIREQATELSGIAQSAYKYDADQNKIKKQVETKVNRWLKSLGGVAAVTPIQTISWEKLVEQAIWREPPFTYDPKSAENEKGFRDALILQTLLRICDDNKGNSANIVFLCKDFLLKSSAEQRLKSNKSVLIFESVVEFESYIKLTREKLTDQFVKLIRSHATTKFFAKDDLSTIYYRDTIKARILKEFEDDLAIPTTLFQAGLGASGSQFYSNLQKLDAKWWMGSTRFKSLVGDREFHWVSSVSYYRLLQGTTSGLGLLAAMQSHELVQIFSFDVNWKAKVKTDGRFHEIQITSIEKQTSELLPATDELRARRRLQRATLEVGKQDDVG
jgi:hypothetical protein